ncbi:toll/interleukin-1 receptor domain-containing protein [Amycolatopsis sp. NPDC003731]
MQPRERPPAVFMSYAHDTDDHVRLVVRLAAHLRRSGIDVRLDQWTDRGRIDWSLWVDRNLPTADYVLVVASPEYFRRASEELTDGEGWGSQYEAAMLRDLLTGRRAHWHSRILPVLLPGHGIEEIPRFLQPHAATRYPVSFKPGGTEDLLRVITGHPRMVPPPLGRPWSPYAQCERLRP